MMSVIIAKNEYIICANKAYANLKEYEDILEKEISVISYVKCCLLRNETLQDFYINGIAVTVYGDNDSYDLYFDDYRLKIDVYDKQIVNSTLERA